MAAKKFYSGTDVRQFCVELEDFEKHPDVVLNLVKSREPVLDLKWEGTSVGCTTVALRIFLVSMLVLRRFGILIDTDFNVLLDTPLETLFKQGLAAQFRDHRVNAIRLIGVAVCNLMHIGAYRLAVAAHNCFLQLIWPLRLRELQRGDRGFADYQLWIAGTVMQYFSMDNKRYPPDSAFFAAKPDPATPHEVMLNGVLHTSCAHGLLRNKDGKCFLSSILEAQKNKAHCSD